jgi:hypothetical protein
MAWRGTRLPDPLVKQLRALHAAGFSIHSLARRLHLSRNTVRRYVRREIPPSLTPPPPRGGV